MATTDIVTALANEARRQELKQKVARLTGSVNTTASIVQRLNSVNSDEIAMLQEAREELATLEVGAGPGVTADYGPKSIVTQLVESERFAAKSATIDYVKTNPECTEEDANAAWTEAALASHPEFPYVIQSGLIMSALYRTNLYNAGLIPEPTWEAHRTFIINTPKPTIETL